MSPHMQKIHSSISFKMLLLNESLNIIGQNHFKACSSGTPNHFHLQKELNQPVASKGVHLKTTNEFNILIRLKDIRVYRILKSNWWRAFWVKS